VFSGLCREKHIRWICTCVLLAACSDGKLRADSGSEDAATEIDAALPDEDPADAQDMPDDAESPLDAAADDAMGGDSADAGPSTEAGVETDDAGPLVNPVLGSETDTTLAGTDGDGNGVRDDLDAHVAAIESRTNERAALLAFAREVTSMMLLGGTPSTTRDAAFAQQVRIVKTIDCLSSLFEAEVRRERVRAIGYALFNNAARLRAYHTADKLLSGTILPPPSSGCDPRVIPGLEP
jgi:hypothetical protein